MSIAGGFMFFIACFGFWSLYCFIFFFFFSSRRRHTRCSRDWSSDVCSSDLLAKEECAGERICHGVRARCSPTRGGGGGNRQLHAGRRPKVEGKRIARVGGERSEERRVGKECRSRWAADR